MRTIIPGTFATLVTNQGPPNNLGGKRNQLMGSTVGRSEARGSLKPGEV